MDVKYIIVLSHSRNINIKKGKCISICALCLCYFFISKLNFDVYEVSHIYNLSIYMQAVIPCPLYEHAWHLAQDTWTASLFVTYKNIVQSPNRKNNSHVFWRDSDEKRRYHKTSGTVSFCQEERFSIWTVAFFAMLRNSLDSMFICGRHNSIAGQLIRNIFYRFCYMDVFQTFLWGVWERKFHILFHLEK